MTLASSANIIFSSLTVLGAFIILGLAISFLTRGFWVSSALIQFFGKNTLLFTFLVALFAASGSLLYSEVIGYDPCKLCWFQRVFMYPQVLLLGLALWRKDFGIAPYSIAFSAVGASISLYDYLLQFGMGFDYITMPMMAFTAFLLIISFWYAKKLSDSSVRD